VHLRILSGGAAEGLVHALAPQFQEASGCGVEGTFSAVGAQRDKLLAGAAADIVILTAALVSDLTKSGHVIAGSGVDLGQVRTGIAVLAGKPLPPIGDADALRAALLAADAVYFPDPRLATAGIHFAKVLDALGVAATLADRLRIHPNGSAAMRAMADAGGQPIGCTQITEILNTPGIALAGPLPKAFELATTYTAAVCSGSRHAELARQFVKLLTGESTRALREGLGFSS
jgi:molybdate transport system substrate-binding protein